MGDHMISPEYLHYLVDTGLIVFLWKVNRMLNKWYDIFVENPPHRHLPGGLIAYPKGMEPGQVGRVNGDQRT
jgi:hypothetical protein